MESKQIGIVRAIIVLTELKYYHIKEGLTRELSTKIGILRETV